MKNEINQKISQFLDDELHDSEQESVLLEISKQPDLLRKMNRYRTVSHALRTDDIVKVNNDFLNQLNKKLEKEPHFLLPQNPIKKRSVSTHWRQASIAVAASVAIVSVLLSQKLNFQDSSQSEPTLALVEQQLNTEQVKIENPLKTKTLDQQANEYAAIQHERLKAYLQAHSDDLYTHGSVTVHPYARMANH